MRKVRAFVLAVLVMVTSAGFLCVQPVRASSPFDDLQSSLTSFLQPNTEYQWYHATACVQNVNLPTLSNFVMDDRNDPFWFPGVVNTTRVSGNGGKGTVYDEYLAFGDITVLNPINIEAFLPNNFEVQHTVGPFQSWTVAYFEPCGNGSTLYGTYSLALASPLITPELIYYELILGNQNLANYYHSTWQGIDPQVGYVTTDANGHVTLPFDINTFPFNN